MEDTLRVEGFFKPESYTKVLILVLMEDTLREKDYQIRIFTRKAVLILVLMEDTLRDEAPKDYYHTLAS